ncbi:Phage-related minor tail protein [Aquimixticola soesokkakensis]|uniref:Phage-related minor tail protein n=1 Tax=Aquimixticola soesokkakensis TaxID=1519096 RepID=A0A1Y5SD90_9RHOB|nr:phage tail tape measure protein [Aquimixticola soesokkakensis]SLN36509.1 Phage-related minor tail protein [Aquimixticola soesokkakensis]
MADDNLEAITILLRAKDKDFQRAMDRNNKLIARMTKDAGKNTTGMAKTVDANFARMGKSATALGKTFVAGLAAGAITTALDMVVNNIGQTVKGIATIGNEAKRSGLSAQAFQEWSYVADQNRIGVDALVDGFKELALRVDEFTVTGVGPAADALKRLGYSSDELKRKIKDPSELMLEMLGRMEGMDKAAQIRISDELFGGAAGERFVEILGQGENALRATIDRAHDMGAVLDEELIAKADVIDRKWADLSTRMGSYGKQFALALADMIPGLATTNLEDIFGTDALAKALLSDEAYAKFADLADISDANADSLSELAAASSALTADTDELANSLAAMAQIAEVSGNDVIADQMARAADNIAGLNAQLQMGMIDIDEYNALLSDTLTEALAAAGGLEQVSGIDMSALIAAIGAVTGQLSAATSQSDQLNASIARRPQSPAEAKSGLLADLNALGAQADAASDYVSEQERLQGLTRDQLALEREVASVRADATEKGLSLSDAQITEIASGNIAANASRNTGGGKSGASGSTPVDDNLREAERWIDRTRTALEKYEAELVQLEALNEAGYFAEAPETYARAVAQVTDSIDEEKWGNMRDGIEDVATSLLTAARNGDNLGQVLLDMLTDAAIRSAAEGLANTLAGIGSGRSSGGGFSGFLGAAISSIFGGARANGGGVQAGQAYLVNENTPNSELFVPSQSGAILNVGQAQRALASQSSGPQQIHLVVSGSAGSTFRSDVASISGPQSMIITRQAVKSQSNSSLARQQSMAQRGTSY